MQTRLEIQLVTLCCLCRLHVQKAHMWSIFLNGLPHSLLQDACSHSPAGRADCKLNMLLNVCCWDINTKGGRLWCLLVIFPETGSRACPVLLYEKEKKTLLFEEFTF